MVEIENIFISNNDVKLEAELFQTKSGNLRPAVLICHPHPQYGGNMFNNVVSGVFNTLIEYDFSCLRFNFRSVGRSTGSHSYGEGDLSDVYACVDFLINDKNFEKIVLCGYSYGAGIGCSAVDYSPKIIGYISISIPFDFMELKYKNMTQTLKPKLFIQGDKDAIAHYENFHENFDSYFDPKSYRIIEGADHSYRGYEKQIANEVIDFLRNL